MDEQLINTLMEVYAERGVNLTEIIRDPMFKSMSLGSQVQLLKDHADKILAKSDKAIGPNEIKPALNRAGKMAGLAAGFGAIGALKEHEMWGPRFKFPVKTVLGMGAIAGGASLALSALSEWDNMKKRKALYEDFAAAKNSDANNAYLKVIIKNQGSPLTSSALKDPIKAKLDMITNHADSLASQDAAIHGRYAAFRQSHDMSPDIRLDEDDELATHYEDLERQYRNRSPFNRFKDL